MDDTILLQNQCSYAVYKGSFFSESILSDKNNQTNLKENKVLISAFTSSINDILNLLEECYVFLLTDVNGVLLKTYGDKKLLRSLKGGSFFNIKVYFSGDYRHSVLLRKEGYYTCLSPICLNENLIGYLVIFTSKHVVKKEVVAILNLLIYKIINEYKKLLLQEKELKDNKKIEFTNQQLSIIRLISKGLTDEQIAQKMHISINTVRYHKKNIFKKLDVDRSIQAVVKATRLNLI